jgi:pimeloyl-ACP methyl ester carboxylesterase
MLRPLLAALAALALLAPAASAQATAATAPTRTLNADGVRIGYRSFGENRPIVFVMGLGGTMDAWDPVVLDAVAEQGRRVIVFDNEGIGRSTPRRGPLTIRRMADNTAALIRALKLGRPDVFGWSMGGMISQSLAVRHPKLVRRLVLAATTPGIRGAVGPDADVLETLTQPGTSPANALATLFRPGADAAARTYVAHLTRRRNLNIEVPAPVMQQQFAASGAWLLGQDRDGARIRRLRIPVLIGAGALDRVLPVANQRLLARTIPRSRLVVYPRGAHGFFIDHRASFLRRVDAFLTRRG